MTGPTGLASGVESGVFQTLAELVANNNVQQNTIVHVFELDNRGDYYVTAIDEGAGILLDNGLYANPASSGGGHVMLMPKYVVDYDDLYVKSTGGSTSVSNSTFFYDAMEQDFTPNPMEVATYIPSADNLEQTVVDTGAGVSGVLTFVKATHVTPAGLTTIKVIADGVEHVYSSEVDGSKKVMVIGDVLSIQAQTGSSGATLGSLADFGFNVDPRMTLITPSQSAGRGLPVGIVFEDSLKITVQASTSFVAGSTSNKCVAAWLTYIPEGVL